MRYDAKAIRSEFPALSVHDGGVPRIYFDNPAGTQVSQSVVDAMSNCMLEASANLGGNFPTSESATALVDEAHVAMADLLNAKSPEEIIFGQNMTTLTLYMSRSIGKKMQPGDEIILTRMDHDANVQPWVLLARDLGLEIRWLPFDLDSFEFDLSLLDQILTEKTKLICVGGASNLTGTINDVRTISQKAHDVGAWTYIDAVQSVPHVSTDVQDLGCDFLVCSAYKFFGPHQGILWGKRDVLEQLEAYKVRPAPDEIPGCFETGTMSHEGMAGTTAAVDYLASIGEIFANKYQDKNQKYHCLADKFTATLKSSNPASFHFLIWLHTVRRTHSPRGNIRPVSSAIGINSAGEIIPSTGSGHLNSASILAILPVARSTIG